MKSSDILFFKVLSRFQVPVIITIVAFLFQNCESTQEQQVYKIGFSQCVTDDYWRQTMHQEMDRELFFYRDELDFEIKDAGGDSEQQIQQIEEFLKEGVDLLMVSPNESAPITPVIEKAFNSGIPVVVLDRKTTSSLYTAYVGADNEEIGKIAGRYVERLIQPDQTIVEIWGLKGSSPAMARSAGFNSELKTDSVNLIQIFANWSKENAKQLVSARLDDIKEATVVFAHNDQMALGAYEVFKEAGITTSCKFVGVDALGGPGGGIQLVTDGILDATFLYPTGGDVAIRTAYNILTHQPYEKENILQTTLVDASNVRIMKLQTDEIRNQQNEIERQHTRITEQMRVYKNQQLALYLLLGFLTLSIILGAYAVYSLREIRIANKALRVKNQMINEQKEEIQRMAEKAEEATTAKFRFFTNISHEFRTPLTLILGPLDGLLRNSKINRQKTIVHDLSLIKKNAYRLLRLINQLMAFRKIEHNKLTIGASEHDIISFVRDICSGFESLALKNKIDFKLIAKETSLKVWFDQNWLDKVIFNLLSNALKFTPKSGYIHLIINKVQQSNEVIIQVKDSGSGMSSEHVQHAFDRYYSGSEYSDMGTGLGLSLSREIIQLHKGAIDVESEKHVGTTFTIRLKLGKDHFSEDELFVHESARDFVLNAPDMIEAFRDLEEDQVASVDSNLPTILIIEDNPDVIEFVRANVAGKFNVLVAMNGEEGIQTALNQIPDLIICDIMIPLKDGLVVTKNMKSDTRTCHIPIVLLTAKTEEEEKIKGMKAGAEVYITKPFSMDFLTENINSLLQNRAMLKSHYVSEAYMEGENIEGTILTKDPDKEFVRKFKQLVNDNLQDAQFGVKEICTALGFSRIQLYRKVKVLLDSTVNDYINTMRLKKALKLLQTTDMNIGEIAFECGFSSPTYFSTAFKSFYKVSPSEVKRP